MVIRLYGCRNEFTEVVSVPVLPFALRGKSKVNMFGKIMSAVRWKRCLNLLLEAVQKSGPAFYLQLYRQELTDIFKCIEVFFFFFIGKFFGIVVGSHAMVRNDTDSMCSLPRFSPNNILQNYSTVLQPWHWHWHIWWSWRNCWSDFPSHICTVDLVICGFIACQFMCP